MIFPKALINSILVIGYCAKLFCSESSRAMIIAVGSTNQAKILAVKEVIGDLPQFSHAQVVAFSTSSGVREQPCSLQETIQGAKNRARNAFDQCKSCNYSFGIESGSLIAHKSYLYFLSFFFHEPPCRYFTK